MIRFIYTFLLLLIFSIPNVGQEIVTHQKLLDQYKNYEATSIKNRRFKHADIVPLIQKLKPPFKVQEIGKSIEGRSIYRVQLGNGPTKVLLWSQMHGNEPTATMALMDVFNFFSVSDQYDGFRQKLLEELTLVFIPMLNPDGAEQFERRNALGVDLNRDAIRLQSPEAKLLKQQRDELDADWGFNLHDQSRYYSAGQHPKTAAFSFLAPAYNYEKEVNPSREDAMQLIGVLDNLLQPHLPGNVGRYNDDFEPRAFGDNIQKWGTRTVLIEVGGLKDDLEKQYLRKLHFMLFLKGLEAIADRSYEQVSRDIYESIPFNDYNNFHDLILREVEVENNGNWYTLDIAFKQYEVDTRDGRDFYQIGEITDVGDLSVYYGYEELQGTGLRAYAGKVYSKTLKDAKALERLNPMQLLRQGITTVRMEEVPQGGRYRDYPLHIIATSKGVDTGVAPGERTSLILKKGKQVKYAVVNGRLFALK